MNYMARVGKIRRHRTKANGKPEFEFSKIARAWLSKKGFSIEKVESKAVYSESAGRFLSGQTVAGFSDLVGVTPYLGVSCYIELKAPGKRCTLKDHQREFLITKINHFAFAACVDSIDYLERVWSEWLKLRQESKLIESKTFLLKELT